VPPHSTACSPKRSVSVSSANVEGEGACLPGDVLVNREEARGAAAFDEHLAHAVPGRLRCDHRDVHVLRWHDPVEANGEAVGKHQHLADGEVLFDVGRVHLRLMLVGHENHDHVGPPGGVGDAHHGHAGRPSLLHRLARRRQADDHVHPAVFQIERVRVPLRSIADDRHLLPTDQLNVRILVVEHRRHGNPS
jgi:hypothetical protein